MSSFCLHLSQGLFFHDISATLLVNPSQKLVVTASLNATMRFCSCLENKLYLKSNQNTSYIVNKAAFSDSLLQWFMNDRNIVHVLDSLSPDS